MPSAGSNSLHFVSEELEKRVSGVRSRLQRRVARRPRSCDIDCHSLAGLSLSRKIRFVQYWVFLASKSVCFLCNASTQACLSSLVFECLYFRSSFRHVRRIDRQSASNHGNSGR